MLIIKRLNYIDAASGIVTLKTSEWSKITRVKFANFTPVILDHSLAFRVTIPDAASIQFNLLMMSI